MKKILNIKEKASKIINSKKIDNKMLEEALKKYTEAIDLKIKDKINAILYSNRAWVNLRLERNGAALEDANKAIEWDPDYIKGYYRRGCANLTLCKYEEALTDLENVKKKFPSDNSLIEKINEIKIQLEKKNKNKNRINNSSNNDNSLEISPEELLDIKYIEDEIKREENKLNKNKNVSPENGYKSDNSDSETVKKPEYKGKLSLTKAWIVDVVIEEMKKKILCQNYLY